MKLEEILTGTADGVCAVDSDGRIVMWNQAAERILGHGAGEALGRPCCDLFAGHDAAGNRLCYPGCQVLELSRRNEPIHHFDMAARTRDGRPIWLDVSILVVPRPRAKEPAVVHLFRDVTARRNKEAILDERMALPRSAAGLPDEISGLLTRREMQTLMLMVTGIGTKAIASRLHVSPSTVRNHVQSILGKMGVHSRLEAISMAASHGLLPPARPRA